MKVYGIFRHRDNDGRPTGNGVVVRTRVGGSAYPYPYDCTQALDAYHTEALANARADELNATARKAG